MNENNRHREEGESRQEAFERKVQRAMQTEAEEQPIRHSDPETIREEERAEKRRVDARKREAKRKFAEEQKAERARNQAKRKRERERRREERKELAQAHREARREQKIREGRKVPLSDREKQQLKEERRAEARKAAEQRRREAEERKRAAESARREKKRQKAEMKRQARARRMKLRHATPAERRRLLAEKRVERERRRQTAREAAAQRRADRRAWKNKRREERAEARRRLSGSGGAGGRWVKSTAVLAAVCSVFVVFSGVLAATTVFVRRQKDAMAQALNNIYEQNFFDLMDNMSNLSVRLSKLMVSTGEDSEKYLIEVVRQSDATANHLAELPVAEQTILNTMKYVNQLGDFCGVLQRKLAGGGELSEGDIDSIEQLYDTNVALYQEMRMLYDKIVAGYRFTDHLGGDGLDGNAFSDAFDEIQNGSVEYPKLIYDGPFSESVVDAEAKLTGEEVSKETAQENAEQALADVGVGNLEYVSETDGKIVTYNFRGEANGTTAFVQVTKKGGHLILYSANRLMDNFTLSVEECVQRAEKFAEELGFQSVRSVWSSDYDGVVYVNLVEESDGVLLYPDMIKIKVTRDTGEILGFDALTYYMNHTEREVGSPALSVLHVRQNISAKLDIQSERLVLIPTESGGEELCYEFYGTYREMLYFIYADANTGKEVNIFCVVDSDSGALIM